MREQETICLKELELITPEYAGHFGLVVDEPVFISSTDSTDQRPYIYRVGATIGDSHLDLENADSFVTTNKGIGSLRGVKMRPRYGIGYDETRNVLINNDGYWRDMKFCGWVAIVEPTGMVFRNEDDLTGLRFNRITNELKINRILAFCSGCLDQPLNFGIIVGPFASQTFGPACSFETHKKDFQGRKPFFPKPKWEFEILETGEVVFSSFEPPQGVVYLVS